jgi:hypothetical protein
MHCSMAEMGKEGFAQRRRLTPFFASGFSHALLIAFCSLPFLSGPKTTSYKRRVFCVLYVGIANVVRILIVTPNFIVDLRVGIPKCIEGFCGKTCRKETTWETFV